MRNFTRNAFLCYSLYAFISSMTNYFLNQPGEHFIHGDKNIVMLTIFLQLCDIGFYIGFLEVLTFTSKKLKINRIILESLIIFWLVMMTVTTTVDTLNQSSLMQNLSFAYFKTYEMSPEIYQAKKNLNIIRKLGIEKKQTAIEVITDFFKVNGITLILIICNVVFYSLLCIVIFAISLRHYLKKGSKQQPKDQTEKKHQISKNTAFIVISLIDVIMFIVFLSIDGSNESKLQDSAPGNWQIWKSLSGYIVNENKLQNLIQQERSLIPIPKDVFYLDNRQNNIQFPYAVGNKQVYCKFNKDNQTCTNLNQQINQNIPTPNVVLIIVESMSANPLILKDQPFPAQYNYTPFNSKIIPNLAKISSLGSTNIGVTSLGLPTILGWFGLQTGNIPLRYGIGIIQQRRQTHLTLAKIFKKLNFSTSYVSPAPPHFDGKQNILYNGDFDFVTYKMPTEAEGYVNFTSSDWIADRITEQQVEKLIMQQNQPFFANWFTIDTHANWQGFDNQQYYNQSIERNFSRMANYFDQQLGKLHEFLKKDYNNTILVIVGDHGPRWATYPSSYIGWDFNCTQQTFNDEYFGTTTTTAYLGENPTLKTLFNLGTSYNRISDVNEFFLEFQNSLTRILNLPLVSNRVSAPYALTHRIVETHLNGKVTRSYLNSFKKMQEFDQPITCRMHGNEKINVQNENPNSENLKLAKKFIVLRNSISAQNRMWDDQFYCTAEECELPKFKQIFNREYDFMVYIYIVAPVLLLLVVGGVVFVCEKIKPNGKVGYEKINSEEVSKEISLENE